MKRVLTTALCATLFVITSCEKEKIISNPPPATLILSNDTVADQILSTPAKRITMGSFPMALDNMGTKFALSSINLTFQGTSAVSTALENFQIVIRSVGGTFVDSCALTKSGIFSKKISIPGSAAYQVDIFGDINKVVLGTFRMNANIRYLDADSIAQSTTAIGHITTFVRRSVPGVIDRSVPTTTIVNGKEMTVRSTDISASDGDIGIKQVSYQFAFADNGIPSPLGLSGLKFFENDRDITSQITAILDADYVMRIVYSAGIGESSIDSGTTKNYKLKFTPNGFGSGDGFSCTRLSDNTGPDDYKYVAKDENGIATLSDSRTDAGTIYNFIWSPKDVPEPSMIFGLSTKNALSGKGIASTSAATVFVAN